jgi:two-component system sensor histidine kinase/response regulator
VATGRLRDTGYLLFLTMTPFDTPDLNRPVDAVPSPLPAWDPQAIERLVGANQAMQHRLLTRFVATSADTLAGIEAAHAGADLPELMRLAHSLKSAARSVGAMALGEQCFALESAARAADWAQCQRLAPTLADLFSTSKSLIEAKLQGTA